MTELTRCVFCKSEKTIIDGAGNDYWVHCNHCSAKGPLSSNAFHAVEAWNAALSPNLDRVKPEPQIDQMRFELVKAALPESMRFADNRYKIRPTPDIDEIDWAAGMAIRFADAVMKQLRETK